ncbi:metallophosphoesterase [Virgibacillus sp. AGTR]|uniref:metallophosphoesterase n=1 Tax=Virgibacillus sp. AGTR TaxID=2812055 RepID=UPI001D164E5E|nr:metallophosphoesterase [Virgibacillus sp. AGTR]MCC2250295.1 metallophosphoesterase [Virgibacillus sp. AGTR]
MRLGIISDLHIDVNREMVPANTSYIEILYKKIQKEAIDILLIAGDISNDYQISIPFLNDLEAWSNIKVLFVPGNHDYWSKENQVTDTWEIYKAYKAWHGCLSNEPYVLNEEWVVIGDSGWYDYSFGDSSFSVTEFDKGHYMNRTWQDFIYTSWGRSNIDMHEHFYQKISEDLEAYKDKKIIMMTHMLSHASFTVPMPNKKWAYFNAFLGSELYSTLYDKYDVRYGIMGHVHYRKVEQTDKTTMICACVGNNSEWQTKNLAKEIDDAFYVLELEG